MENFIFLPEVGITNYFQSKLRDEKWRHKSDIDHFLKNVVDCSVEHIIPTEGLFKQEPSHIESFFFGADQDHIFSYTFEDLVADYMEEFISSLHMSFCGYTPNFCREIRLCIIYFLFRMNCIFKINW